MKTCPQNKEKESSFQKREGKMGKMSTKSPKTKPKFSGKFSKNGDTKAKFDQQDKVKMGSKGQPRKVKKQFRLAPSKVQSLGLAKKKTGLDKQEKGFNKEQEKKSPLKVSSLRSNKKGFGLDKQENGKLGLEKKQFRTNPLKVSSLRTAKKGVVLDDKQGKGKPGFDEEQQKKQIATNPSKVPNWKTAQRKIGDSKKKKLEDDAVEAKPKRKKRVIRIDRYDTSNKRLDDGIVLNDITNQKKEKKIEEGEVEKVELSMNAQFRAIKPSPSILSFVEDNLLGRRRDIELRRAGYNTELSAPLDNIPFSMSLERERIEESIFRNKMEFFAAAKVSSSFPPPDLPEIAFAGRSNVGKSSLLNALTRQWGVVRTSDKPGHTQSINFFKLGTKLSMVDLPGYGLAYAKEEVKEAWEELVKEYVSTRVGLKRVCLLIDTKWGIKPRDHELIHLMERSQTKYQIVLTKTDTVFPLDVARRAMQIEETLKESRSAVQPLMMVSSKSGAGIRSLRTVLGKLARFVKP